MILRLHGNIGPDAKRRVERLMRFFVTNQLNRTYKTDTACLPNQRVVAITMQSFQKMAHHIANMPDDVALLVNLQGLNRDRGGHRVTRIGEAVSEGPNLIAVRTDRVEQLLIYQHGGNRQVGRRKCLRHGHDIGLDVKGLGPEHIAGPPKAADNLVGNH